MDWKDLGTRIVQNGAPLLGGVLGCPRGVALGRLVAPMFGADPDEPDDIAERMAADPDAYTKLSKFQLEHHSELEKLILTDMQASWQRETESPLAKDQIRWPMYTLATIIVIGFLALMGFLMKIEIPEGSKEAAYLLFGTLSASFGAVVNFFFGSSKGSSDKNSIIRGKK
ncbi:hypothetical protein [Desulfonema magnum]|uniref:Uncharacterized protein n=1 Tax=Desulfonema magnum TaxID=45655 RepID=A0A975GRZ3_9BACT|nr:hypothetical protein [Desulfonema magnum]QTA90523.1 Uncharacterized protein dnm_065840 [Desulfonema magnum]